MCFRPHCRTITTFTISQITSHQHNLTHYQYRPTNTLFWFKALGLHERKARWCGAEPNSSGSDTVVVERKQGCVRNVFTHNPNASSWAPSPRAWWLCKRHEPHRTRWAGTAPQRCDPSESVPTFSPTGVYTTTSRINLTGEKGRTAVMHRLLADKKETEYNWPFKTANSVIYCYYPTKTSWCSQHTILVLFLFVSQ